MRAGGARLGPHSSGLSKLNSASASLAMLTKEVNAGFAGVTALELEVDVLLGDLVFRTRNAPRARLKSGTDIYVKTGQEPPE